MIKKIEENELQQALNAFNLKYSELKEDNVNKSFKELVFKCHPDTSSSSGVILDMDLLKSHKNILLEQCEHITGESKNIRVRKVTEEDVFMTNKVLCTKCEGYGDIENINIFTHACDSCNGKGVIIACKFCEDGKITTGSGKVVECASCNGTGIFGKVSGYQFHHLRNLKKCNDCAGSGRMKNNSLKSYHTCGYCEGEGFTKIKNPIFESGTLF